ncbi:tetratricopeptide repeat protein 36 [Lampetra fluviatilis]
MATENDCAVLQAIFNPNTPFGDIPGLDNPHEVTNNEDSGFDPALLAEAKALEMQGVACAEDADLDRAVHLFDRAIELLPQRPSAYNNRAQALRLQGDTAGALADLDKTISLGTGTGHSACQALVQRGLIRRLQDRNDEAVQDFQLASALGSAFARQQLVQLNPYAALCNRMLAQVIGQMRNPEPNLDAPNDH